MHLLDRGPGGEGKPREYSLTIEGGGGRKEAQPEGKARST